MKNLNKLKIIFLISFVPYILLLIPACYNAVFGYYDAPLLPGGASQTYYGFEAVKYTIFWYGFIFSIIIPVFPICVVYQIIYLIITINKKIRQHRIRLILF